MNARYARILETRELLAQRFPAAFKPKREQKVPLAIGIHRQVFDACPELSRKIIRDAIADYVNGPKYLGNLETGTIRVNLEGTPSGIVSIEQAGIARARLAELQARWEKKRKARLAAKRAEQNARRMQKRKAA